MSAAMGRWPVVRLGDVADTALGKMLDRGKSRSLPQVPYLRNVNVQWGRVDTRDLLTMEMSHQDRGRFAVEPGDLLVCEGGEIGRAAIWRGRSEYLAYQKALHRVRSKGPLDLGFLRYLLELYHRDGTLSHFATGSTIAHLPQQKLRILPVPLPSLWEQRRIVEILEDHLSRLDAAACQVQLCRARLAALENQTIRYSLSGGGLPRHPSVLAAVGCDDGQLSDLPEGWAWTRLGEVADVVGGVTKDAKKQSDSALPEWPYLRVANVQRGRLDLSVVTRIRVPRVKAESLFLRPGDVLLSEGGDRDKLGRGWVWDGQIDNCIHQNHVFRARIRDNLVEPHLLSWAANTFGGAWCERNGKQSVNLASISLSRIRLMPIPLPPRDVQPSLVRQVGEALAACQRLDQAMETAELQSKALRRATLVAAFSGRLTGRSADIDVVEEMAGV